MAAQVYDVIVIGAGNAGLCAALAARERGRRVLLLEKGPHASRGGNTRFSGGGFRFTYADLEDIRPMLPDLSDREAQDLEVGTYSASDFFDDSMHVTEYAADKQLTNVLVAESYPTVRWLTQMGVKWVLAASAYGVRGGGKLRFPLGRVTLVNGGGHGLVETLFGTARNMGIDIVYEAKATGIQTDKKGAISGVRMQTREGNTDFKSRAVVLASGGFEANPEMRATYLGAGWDVVKVRGSRYNTGETLNIALGVGAQSTGQWSGCHAILVDAEAPDVEAAREHRHRPSYPYGIMVDIHGKRFVDEGEDFFIYTHLNFCKAVFGLPWRIAFQIFDSKVKPLLRPEYNQGKCVTADSVRSLGDKLVGLDAGNLVRTVDEFNDAVVEGAFDPSKRDGKCAKGISPTKSNWAQRIDAPPFYAYPVTCGITFTFGGLKTTEKSEVLNTEGNVIKGLFAAGEITGGLFYHNYLAGAGLMKGAVFGRIAGIGAASTSEA